MPGTRLRQTLEQGATFDLDLSDRIQAQAFIVQRYEPEVVRLIRSRLSPGGIFLDVGANVGLVTFSVGAGRPDVTICAFEPNPVNANGWLRNRELNPGVNATLEQVAVGEHEGSLELVAPQPGESGAGYVGDRSVHQPHTGIEVRATTLDRYTHENGIALVDVVKLDIEGYEMFALRGSYQLLRERRIGCIVCELNDIHLQRSGMTRHDLIAYLREHRYEAFPLPQVGARRLRNRETLPQELMFLPSPN